MSDSAKTWVFVAAALAAIGLARDWRGTGTVTPEDFEGQELFPDFEDPDTANSLEIVTFDEKLGKISQFKVAKEKGVWSIPSHDGYPADAAKHLADAATSVVGLTILGVASSDAAGHELFGVVAPDTKSVSASATGVGMRVTFRDASNKKLIDMIVGKSVKDQAGVRYMRRGEQDAVYRVKMSTDQLSTRFADWIEKDLLKLSSFDIRDVNINDYSGNIAFTQTGLRPNQLQRSRMKLRYDDQESQWRLVELTEFNDQGEPVEVTLQPNEELNTTTLNDLRRALDDLKIVDVHKKPEGLSGEFEVSKELADNQEAIASLFQTGFYPVGTLDGGIEIWSSEGEVIVGMKDGVEYVLRFGAVAGEGSDDQDEASQDDPQTKDDVIASVNRFLLVTARLNKGAIAPPELEALPGALSEDAAAEGNAAGDAEPDAEPSPAEKSEDAPADSQDGEAEASETATPDEERATADAASDEPAAEEPEDTEPEDTEQEDTEQEDTEPKDAEQEDTEQPEAEAPDAAELAKQRADVEKANKRRQEEYDAKVKKSEERVAELNDRFADWYYVISDDVYRKIHLGRDEIIKAKEAPSGQPAGAPGAASPAFNFDALKNLIPGGAQNAPPQ